MFTTAALPPKISHLERTAAEPRSNELHSVVIKQIEQVNSSIRLFRLGIPDGHSLKFLAGQWLDVFVPGVPKAGGFTITSPPSKAIAIEHSSSTAVSTDAAAISGQPRCPYVELAIQESPSNPPAAYLFRPPSQLINQTLQVRVGGSFTFPPAESLVQENTIKKIVFIAGGVGINPLISMASHIAERPECIPTSIQVQFLYSTKTPLENCASDNKQSSRKSKILFLDRLAGMFAEKRLKGELKLFLTDRCSSPDTTEARSIDRLGIEPLRRRITLEDMNQAIGGKAEQAETLVYVCGVPAMTDQCVDRLTAVDGLSMPTSRVLFEKWW